MTTYGSGPRCESEHTGDYGSGPYRSIEKQMEDEWDTVKEQLEDDGKLSGLQEQERNDLILATLRTNVRYGAGAGLLNW